MLPIVINILKEKKPKKKNPDYTQRKRDRL